MNWMVVIEVVRLLRCHVLEAVVKVRHIGLVVGAKVELEAEVEMKII